MPSRNDESYVDVDEYLVHGLEGYQRAIVVG